MANSTWLLVMPRIALVWLRRDVGGPWHFGDSNGIAPHILVLPEHQVRTVSLEQMRLHALCSNFICKNLISLQYGRLKDVQSIHS